MAQRNRKAQDLTLINLQAVKKLLTRELAKRDAQLRLLQNNIRMVRQRVQRLEERQ